MANKQDDKWILRTYGYDVDQLYHTLYSISGHPVSKSRRVLLVEGNDDKNFYKQFTIPGVPIFFITKGCENMNNLINLLHKDQTPVLAIQDSDFYRLDGNKKKTADMFYTDKHDWEMTAMANFRVFINFMTSLGVSFKDMKKIICDSFSDLEYLSYYKWYNVRNRCLNDFGNINIAVQTATTSELSNYTFLTSLIPATWRGSRKVDIHQALLKVYIQDHKIDGIEFNLITGHHLLDRFLYYLSKMGVKISSQAISKRLMQSVNLDEFKKTTLYKDIKKWEIKNINVFTD